MKKLIAAALVAMTLLTAGTARAQDEGLYDPVAPAGSAFVRFINGGTDAADLKPALNGKTYGALARFAESAYFPVKAGKTQVSLGAHKTEYDVQEKLFYTAVLRGETLTLVEDRTVNIITKSMIAFYNLSETTANLKSTPGLVNIIGNTRPGESAYREINAVPVTLGAFDNDTEIVRSDAVTLNRNKTTSFVLYTGEDGKPVLRAAQVTIDTRQ